MPGNDPPDDQNPGNPGSPPPSEIILYQTEDGRTRVECRFADETIWLTQALIAELFGITVPTVNEHLKGIYEDGELDRRATLRSFRIVRTEGNRQVARQIDHYNLDAILAVGYRVRSARGTQFRQWATAKLSEYLVKGFVMDDERLKHPPGPGVPDYFDELLDRIRDIRASEARMYLRLRDILALAADYDPKDADCREFFAIVQNKLLYAVTGKTAPELIASRAEAEKPNMGLTTWKGGRVAKADVTVSKNYLKDEEIGPLNRLVVMFLDYAEDQAERRRQVFLSDWREKLDGFLSFNDRPILRDAGKVSRESANEKAQQAYEQFAERRRLAAEAEGLRELEDQAKKLPPRPRPRPRKNDETNDAESD